MSARPVNRALLLATTALAICATPGVAAPVGAAPGDTAETLAAQTVPATGQEVPEPADKAPAADAEEVDFSAATLEYDMEADIVTATGDVRMRRGGDRLRADKVTWNRKTAEVVATGNISVVNSGGDTAYGDEIRLTDSLKDGVVDNMLVVLDKGGRLAARRGTRALDESVTLDEAAYTPCAVTDSDNCPKEPSWKITAVRVVYRPDRQRVYYNGARISLFGLTSIPLPRFSHSVSDVNSSGLLAPVVRIGRVNGLEYAQPYYFALAPNRGLKITPRVFSSVLPMIDAEYTALDTNGSFRIAGWATYSGRTDNFITTAPSLTTDAFRGYLDGVGRYQIGSGWQASGSIRIATDRTFLRRYDISRDDRLRSTLQLERIDADSYFAVTGWAVQTLRVNDRQGLQPIALPEVDFRLRMDDGLVGGRLSFQVNSLAITRTAGQDTQRAFASARWDWRGITRWGQEVTLTGFARGDLYNTDNVAATSVISYRGVEGFQARAVGAIAVDVKWPLIGSFLGGTQRITPRFQVVAAPRTENLDIPNEDARAVDLEDSNLFALNRFAGYDRFEDSTRFTYGIDYRLDRPGLSVEATIGQSYRITNRPALFPDGTGLTDRVSDIVGRTEVRVRDFVTFTHRYRLDKDNLAVRRNELDATVGTRGTYALIGYLRLNRNIGPALEDLQDREEARIAGRVQINRFWSVFGSAVIDLTDRAEDVLSLSDGFDPLRHRIGVAYEDDCLKLGVTWRRDYQDTGDARRGDSFLLTLAFKNLGR